MACDKSRRTFLTKDLFRAVTGLIADGLRNNNVREISKYDYFSSYETCYPLLSESGELLMDEARKKGIDIRGKNKMDIAREVFTKEGAKSD
ncbi:MAG TPA: hypothetical protein VMT12_01465 [Syntrophales bacterium]|nr:hypothetical protein [Syntrophales bacterium]